MPATRAYTGGHPSAIISTCANVPLRMHQRVPTQACSSRVSGRARQALRSCARTVLGTSGTTPAAQQSRASRSCLRPAEPLLLFGDTLRQQLFVGGARRRSRLLDEFAQVGAHDRDAIVEFRDRRGNGCRRGRGRRYSCRCRCRCRGRATATFGAAAGLLLGRHRLAAAPGRPSLPPPCAWAPLPPSSSARHGTCASSAPSSWRPTSWSQTSSSEQPWASPSGCETLSRLAVLTKPKPPAACWQPGAARPSRADGLRAQGPRLPGHRRQRRIGAGIARLLAEQGVRVAATARRVDRIEQHPQRRRRSPPTSPRPTDLARLARDATAGPRPGRHSGQLRRRLAADDGRCQRRVLGRGFRPELHLGTAASPPPCCPACASAAGAASSTSAAPWSRAA